jgi:thioester reductase-like protein
MAYMLLTGATGLLGRYLLRDLTLADIPLAVIVRSSKRDSAVSRIETAMAHWEKELGRALVRPVVLEGDITESRLGLSDREVNWLAENCSSIVHSAASLTFYAEEKTGEPYRSNIQGTRNVLELCRLANIRQCHYVSTAYVCGQRRGRVMESELDVGQEPSNDYEKTKLQAENEVLASDVFDQVTVYRPSIIVGDAKTGFTTSYHGFYTPLRLAHSLISAMSWEDLMTSNLMGELGVAGQETKNLVPVDWVSEAMAALICRPECHGKTYHLTNPTAVIAKDMQQVILESLADFDWSRPKSINGHFSAADIANSFRDQMKIYQSYWHADPEFDSMNTESALPHLPCPVLANDVLLRMAKVAVAGNFGWPREATVVPPFDVAQRLDKWLASPNGHANGNSKYLSLLVSGQGGGQWHVVIDQGKVVGAGVGQHNGSPTCYMTSDTFARLSRGEWTFQDSLKHGRLLIAGNAMHPSEVARVLGEVISR